MADNTPDIIVARSLGGLLGGLLRQRAYWARWLGLNVLLGTAIAGLLVAIAWFASLWHTLPMLAYPIAIGGAIGIAVLHYVYGRSPLNACYLAFAVAQARVHRPDAIPDGPLPYGYGVTHGRQLFAAGRFDALRFQIQAALRASHRHLIDVLAWIDWLRRVKLSGVVTELTHGTVTYLSYGVEGQVLADDNSAVGRKAVSAITSYLAHWKPLLKSAIRSWIGGLIIWAIASVGVLLLGYPLVRAFPFWPSQVLVFAALLFWARFFVRGVYHPLAQALMIDRLAVLRVSPEQTVIWEERLSKVSREFQELLRMRSDERLATETPAAELNSAPTGCTGSDGCFEAES